LEIKDKLLPLLPHEDNGKTSPEIERLAQILEIVRVEESVPLPKSGGKGRPQADRRAMARAFVAKAALNLPETKTLIQLLSQSSSLRQVCGLYAVPSKATFSRAFTDFAKMGLGDRVHAAMVAKFVSGNVTERPLVMHVSLDSTAVEARDMAIKKVKLPKEKKTRQAETR
jgi:transposase